MKHIAVALASFLLSALCLHAAIVYVKPDGTGDGSSWATAKGDLRAAVADAADQDEIHVAAGIYYWSSLLTLNNKKITILGGFAGVSEDETADSETYRTIISGDVAHNDQWVVHDIYQRLYNNKTTPVRELGPVIQDGQLIIPEITEEYEIAVPDIYGKDPATSEARFADNASLFAIGSTCNFTLKDVWITGAGTVGQTGGTALNSSTSRLLLERVRFIGNKGHEGLVQLTGSYGDRTILKNCTFLWNHISARGLIRTSASHFVLEDVDFIGALQTGGQGACACFICGGQNCTYSRCRFEKCYGAAGSWGQSAAVGSQGGHSMTFADCTFTNNFSGNGLAPSAVNFSFHSGCENTVLRNCLFTENKSINKRSSGTIVNLGAVCLGKDGATVESCTFLGNTCDSIPSGTCKNIIAAPLTLMPPDSTSSSKLVGRNVVNCTFLGNKVTTSKGDNGAESIAARSILVNTSRTGNPIDVVIANCTFTGDTPYPDVVWTGVDTSAKTRILNSIFWKTGDTTGYLPFESSEAGVLSVTDCIANGISGLPTGIEGGGLSSIDPHLGAPEQMEGHPNFVIRPGANVPGLKGGRDLARFAKGNHYYYCYANPLEHISDAPIELPAEADPLPDAVGAARPAGQSTKGAVQRLSDAAENGWTVFLDVVPKGSGTLSGGEMTQVVPKGGSIVAVTADPVQEDFVFEGWKDANGTSYGTDRTLQLGPVTSDLALYATFRTPDVTWTFDLCGMGTFDDGSSRKTYTLRPGTHAPELVYTIDETKCVPYGWDAPVPETVGIESRVFTFTYLEKIHRIVRVDTNVEGGAHDGSSWANAMTDIQEAIDLAALWTGEVWIKQGVHRSGDHANDFLMMKNNVAIRGGFEGVDGQYATIDEERNARDADRFLTILTGDLDLDDYWKGDVHSQAYKVDGETLRLLDKDGRPTFPAALEPGDFYCLPNKVGTNISPIFDHSAAVLDQTAILDGITVMGGTVMDNCLSAHPQMTNCTFLGSACFTFDDWMTFRDCTFSVQGINNGLYLENTGAHAGSQAWTILDNCLFTNCAVKDRGAFAVQSGNARLKGCRFVNCRKDGDGGYVGAAIGAEVGKTELFDCQFIDNFCTNGCRLVQLGSYGSIASNCLFRGNQGFYTAKNNSTRGMVLSTCYDGRMKVYNCAFVSNSLQRYVSIGTSAGDSTTAIVLPTDSGSSIVNCTFEGNRISVTSEDPARAICGATFALRFSNSGGIVNCTFRNNEAPDGDIGLATRDGTAPVNVINSIFWSDAHDYHFAHKEGNDTAELNVIHSTAKGFDSAMAGLASHENVSTANPVFSSRIVKKGPLSARALAGSSPALRGGCDVYADAKGTLCYLADETPTYKDCLKNTVMTPVEPLVPLADIFGNERVPGRFAQGALQLATPARTLLMLR